MTPSTLNLSKSDFLLEKGMEILWSKGYNATSVNDIVKALDYSKKYRSDYPDEVIEKLKMVKLMLKT